MLVDSSFDGGSDASNETSQKFVIIAVEKYEIITATCVNVNMNLELRWSLAFRVYATS